MAKIDEVRSLKEL